MAIIKHISVHTSPMRLLKYITQENKTDTQKLVTGLNVNEDAEYAYEEMKKVFERFSRERFYKKSLEYKDSESAGKERIRLHHYIQSFAKGEITPEQAHDIGVTWARKVFGENHQILISTHIDKDHIHNHFAVAAYDLDGKAWHDNKTTLKKCRDVSDRLCKARGLSVIEKPKNNRSGKYGEWLARNAGVSWKEKLCDNIDSLILREDVKTVKDLAAQLEKMGYVVTLGKYLSVKAAPDRKAIRTYRLGDGYGIDELNYRIENKDKEMSLAAIARYQGVQREYAICLRELQIMVYRKPDKIHRATYKELIQNTELLCYISDKNIHSKDDFERTVNTAADKALSLKRERDEEQREIARLEEHAEWVASRRKSGITDVMGFRESDLEYVNEKIKEHREKLSRIEKSIEAAETEKANAANNYKTLLRQLETDYSFIFDRVSRDFEKYKENADKPKEDFKETIRKMTEWSDKVQAKAAENRRREELAKKSRNSYGAR